MTILRCLLNAFELLKGLRKVEQPEKKNAIISFHILREITKNLFLHLALLPPFPAREEAEAENSLPLPRTVTRDGGPSLPSSRSCRRSCRWPAPMAEEDEDGTRGGAASLKYEGVNPAKETGPDAGGMPRWRSGYTGYPNLMYVYVYR